jgi:hypothetical protein
MGEQYVRRGSESKMKSIRAAVRSQRFFVQYFLAGFANLAVFVLCCKASTSAVQANAVYKTCGGIAFPLTPSRVQEFSFTSYVKHIQPPKET